MFNIFYMEKIHAYDCILIKLIFKIEGVLMTFESETSGGL